MKTRLKLILADVKEEVEKLKVSRPIPELGEMIKDTPPLRGFGAALREGFGLIAEIKKKSPSAGSMRSENVRETETCYEECTLVKAVSVLTNKHFGMAIENLLQAKLHFSKPILRKDFIIDEYQIYEARAFGADAVLLMCNLLTKEKLQRFSRVAQDLGLDVLFESHIKKEIKKLPPAAGICGINCRLMDSSEEVDKANFIPQWLMRLYHTDIDFMRLNMITSLPIASVKVAESGLTSKNIRSVKDRGYNAALIGTALLTDASGLHGALNKFESVLSETGSAKRNSSLMQPIAA